MKTVQCFAAAVGLSLLLSGCKDIPTVVSPADPHAVYVWPTSACPSESQSGNEKSLFADVGGLLFGDITTGLLNVPAAALANAAAADLKGFDAQTVNARYYGTVAKNLSKVDPPACYVVAYAKPIDAAESDKSNNWCNDSAFSTAMTSSCSQAGLKVLNALYPSAKTYTPGGTPNSADIQPVMTSLTTPTFYAEISLKGANYSQIVQPRVVALYYPKSLLEPDDTDKARTVTISLTPSSFQSSGADPFKGAAVSLLITGIKPGHPLSPVALALHQQSGWTQIPPATIDNGSKPANLAAGMPYYPINITAELHEIGQPNQFLQGFAKAFNSDVPNYAKTAVNDLLPAGQQAAQTQSLANSSTKCRRA